MKYNELAGKTPSELAEMKDKLSTELFHLKIKSRTAQLEKKHQIRQVRKDIARIETKLSESTES